MAIQLEAAPEHILLVVFRIIKTLLFTCMLVYTSVGELQTASTERLMSRPTRSTSRDTSLTALSKALPSLLKKDWNKTEKVRKFNSKDIVHQNRRQRTARLP